MEGHYAPSKSWNWSKRGQYQIGSRWNGITHFLRVQMGPNKVSIKLSGGEWHYALPESLIGSNGISIKLAANGMASRTSWEFKWVATRSVSGWQQMEGNYAQSESSNWSKRGQYQIGSRWNAITHGLRVQISKRKVSIKLEADGMPLHTNWEWKWVATRSVSNEQQKE